MKSWPHWAFFVVGAVGLVLDAYFPTWGYVFGIVAGGFANMCGVVIRDRKRAAEAVRPVHNPYIRKPSPSDD